MLRDQGNQAVTVEHLQSVEALRLHSPAESRQRGFLCSRHHLLYLLSVRTEHYPL